jgi:hypothetical protein
MDEKNLVTFDPSLLNRFEKQRILINDLLNDRQKILVESLSEWAKRISTLVGDESKDKFTTKDLFIGFDKNESLQSLVINVTNNNLKAGDNEILEKCKECLIATASSDGIVKVEQSTLERNEIDQWKNVYFNQQHHESLYDYFANQKELLTNLDGHLLIVNTFSNIDTDVKSYLQGLVSCQVYRLSTFKTEAQLSSQVKSKK